MGMKSCLILKKINAKVLDQNNLFFKPFGKALLFKSVGLGNCYIMKINGKMTMK